MSDGATRQGRRGRVWCAVAPWLASGLAMACSSPRVAPEPEPAAPVPMSTPTLPPTLALVPIAGPDEVLVGNLVRNQPGSLEAPSEYCLDDGRLWRGARFRVGRTNVFDADDRLEAAAGDGTATVTVAVTGRRRPSLDERLVDVGPCPPDHAGDLERMQLRSDWIPDEGLASNTTHARMAATAYVAAVAAVPVTLVELGARTDGQLAIRLHNPFDQPLDGVTITAHYEGGPTKPMPRHDPLDVRLAPGAHVDLTVSLGDQVPGRRGGHRLASIDWSGRAGAATFDVSVAVPAP
ncbi:MAG: hypothetical protein HS111_21425 [Kofleriaceae bacterium]|nr:hypothetical protein [Kofleriaceae bacterium]MCL4223160.1 hypothetical protein [Myxococcales bacterium]